MVDENKAEELEALRHAIARVQTSRAAGGFVTHIAALGNDLDMDERGHPRIGRSFPLRDGWADASVVMAAIEEMLLARRDALNAEA